MEARQDDGSLGFLDIPPDYTNKFFNCKETQQQKLLNTQFWVMAFFDNVHTKHGENRFVVKIKKDKDDPESEALKFFTNSADIKYILKKIQERDAFPRKVTLRANGMKYYFE